MNNFQQIRAIKRYAKANSFELESAALSWVKRGLAKQWRDGNP